MLHKRFRAFAIKKTGPTVYMEGDQSLRLKAIGVLPAVAMLAPPDPLYLGDEYAKRLSQDVLVLIISHRARIRLRMNFSHEGFKSELQRLCKNKAVLIILGPGRGGPGLQDRLCALHNVRPRSVRAQTTLGRRRDNLHTGLDAES